MAFTKITAAGIGTTESVTLDGLSVINNGSFGGNLTVGGVLTYEDVTNVDSVGLITARNGIVVGSGITLSKDGDVFFTGIITGNGSGLTNLTGIDLVDDTSPQLGGNLDVNTKNIVFGDSGSASDDRLTFGAGTDLSLYHDGSHSRIVDSGTGNLILQTSKININNADGTEAILHGTGGGAVEIYHANSVKLNTISAGVRVTGNMSIADGSTSTNKVALGTGDDLNLYHNGTDSYVENKTGDLYLSTTNSGDDIILYSLDDIELKVQSGEDAIKCIGNGAVALYHDNALKFETLTNGIKVQDGTSASTYITVATNAGTQGHIYGTANTLGFLDGQQHYMIKAVKDGAVELYHDNVKKLATTANGTTFSNTTDDAAMNDCLLLTRRGYEASGYGTKIQVMGGSVDSQNGIRFAHSHSNGGGYTVRQRFDHDGIKFNGDTAAANALDDYEEGTWSPVLQNSSGSLTRATYQACYYIKVGRVVHLYGRMDCDGMSTHLGGVAMHIGGFPFSSGSQGNSGDHLVGVWGGSYNYWENGYPSISIENSQSRHGLFIHRTPAATGQSVYAQPTGNDLGNSSIQFTFNMCMVVD